MIGMSLALVIWTSGLLYLTRKADKKRDAEMQVRVGEEKNFEAEAGGDAKV
jgi:ACS family pantothenate transporter-like MFS transporter